MRGATHPHAAPNVPTRFQSTHPVRGATAFRELDKGVKDISIHAPREGCDCLIVNKRVDIEDISIHAPREGCDAPFSTICATESVFQSTHPVRGATGRFVGRDGIEVFQSTHPVRGATVSCVDDGAFPVISIHAPREGCDFIRR